MSEPTLALQAAILAALNGAPEVSALLAGRVYDRVPAGAVFPYATIGDDQALPDHAECLEGSTEVIAIVHVWSRKVGKPESKTITGAIVRALNGASLSLDPDYRLVHIEHDGSRHLDDPDGLTSHSVITFRSLIDEV
jgi:hypothetical protein